MTGGTDRSGGADAGHTSTAEPVVIETVGADEAAGCVGGLADVLIDCVEGGASVSFMLPISRDTALRFWEGVARGVANGDRVLLVARERPDGAIVGTAQVVFAQPENQPHRADVAKMLVHRRARRRGVAARLLQAVDAAARAHGRSVLVLDTVTGSDAERLYARCGWQRVGSVPRFALMPTGEFCATTFFYKLLSDAAASEAP